MKLTYEILMECRTPRGAWRRVQLAAIGVDWPPVKGWVNRVVGMELTDEQFRQLASGKGDQGKQLELPLF